MSFLKTIALSAMLIFISLPATAKIGIRDAEIEHILDGYMSPLIAASGLSVESVTLNILSNTDLNAFVAEGQNIFINAGLIMQVKTPEELLGVLAHEMGHITGGHLIKREDAEHEALITSLLSGVLIAGAGLGLGGGDPRGAVGGIMAGQMTGLGQMLAYSRVNESAADQAALEFLEKARFSAKGMITLLNTLGQRNGEGVIRLPYATTHPLSSERINLIEEKASESRFYNNAVPSSWVKNLKRMQGKLKGFLQDPIQTLREYPVSDTSVEARYARSAAYHRSGQHHKAIGEVDALIETLPSDPYFYELRGQFFMETGQTAKAINDYRQAYRRSGEAPLIAATLGQALVQQETPTSLLESVTLLKRALIDDPKFEIGWRSLSIAYDRLGKKAEAAVASSEMYMVMDDAGAAVRQARLAKQLTSSGSIPWQRADDIETTMLLKIKKDKNK